MDGCEILDHQKDGWNPINNAMFTIYQLVIRISQPSTVCLYLFLTWMLGLMASQLSKCEAFMGFISVVPWFFPCRQQAHPWSWYIYITGWWIGQGQMLDKCLVVTGTMEFLMTFHSVGNFITPTDELIFFRGGWNWRTHIFQRGRSTTNQIILVNLPARYGK